SSEANALHNPFLSKGRFRSELQIDCSKTKPDASALKRATVALVFPSQDWINAISSAGSTRALFLDRPKAKDLGPIADLPLVHLSLSYPSYVKNRSFIERLTTLVRLSLHNTLSLGSLDYVRT